MSTLTTYDAVVVGARCGGAATAMLLARQGHRVLMVDHAKFPSDVRLSTHLLWHSGVDLLRSDVSRYARRVALMEAKYPNLKFIACGLTLSRLRKSGVTIHLLPNTGSAYSAPDEITRRLREGWDYIRM